MKLSDESRVPLYVSPFFSSTSCTARAHTRQAHDSRIGIQQGDVARMDGMA